MPFVKAKLSSFKLDKGKATKAFINAIEVEIKKAAVKFLEQSASVPVRTGFARGGFLNLETFLQTSVPARASILKGSKRQRSLVEYYYPDRVRKTPQAARFYSTRPNAIIIKTGNAIRFDYKIDISYFNINDFIANHRTPSSPWLSFINGRRAFQNYINRNLKANLPRLRDFIEVTTVGV